MHLFVIRIMIPVFILLYLPCITSGEVEYYVIRNETTWDVANASCTLATPDIIYTYTSGYYQVDVNVPNPGMNPGDRLWLGYFRAYTIFQYIGCMKVMDIISSANYSIDAYSGDCYSICGSSGIFGMKLTAINLIQCFCLESQLNLTGYQGSGCDNVCSAIYIVACGGDQYVSIYEPVQDLPYQKVRKHERSVSGYYGDCVEYDPTSGYLYWRSCSESLQIVCQEETGGALIPPKSDTQNNTWMDTTTACFKDSLYPVTYRSVNRPHGNLKTTLWTGMSRSYVYYKYNGKVGLPTYLYLQFDGNKDGGNTLRSTGSRRTYYSLCQREFTTELTTSTGTKQTNIIETTTESKETDIKNKTTSTKVYVGVSCGTLLLTILVIIVVVVVVRRRRRNEIKRRQRGNDVNGSNIETNNDVNVVYQNQALNIEESRSTKDGSQAVYLNQQHTFKDDGKNDNIHPIDDIYDECKDADIDVQPAHDNENEYLYLEQGPYEDLKQSDSETYSPLQTDTTKDYEDDSAYLYPAQGPYEDLKLSENSTYSQLQMNDQPTNVTYP